MVNPGNIENHQAVEKESRNPFVSAVHWLRDKIRGLRHSENPGSDKHPATQIPETKNLPEQIDHGRRSLIRSGLILGLGAALGVALPLKAVADYDPKKKDREQVMGGLIGGKEIAPEKMSPEELVIMDDSMQVLFKAFGHFSFWRAFILLNYEDEAKKALETVMDHRNRENAWYKRDNDGTITIELRYERDRQGKIVTTNDGSNKINRRGLTPPDIFIKIKDGAIIQINHKRIDIRRVPMRNFNDEWKELDKQLKVISGKIISENVCCPVSADALAAQFVRDAANAGIEVPTVEVEGVRRVSLRELRGLLARTQGRRDMRELRRLLDSPEGRQAMEALRRLIASGRVCSEEAEELRIQAIEALRILKTPSEAPVNTLADAQRLRKQMEAEFRLLGAELKRFEAELKRLKAEAKRIEALQKRFEALQKRLRVALERSETLPGLLDPVAKRLEAEFKRIEEEINERLQKLAVKKGKKKDGPNPKNFSNRRTEPLPENQYCRETGRRPIIANWEYGIYSLTSMTFPRMILKSLELKATDNELTAAERNVKSELARLLQNHPQNWEEIKKSREEAKRTGNPNLERRPTIIVIKRETTPDGIFEIAEHNSGAGTVGNTFAYISKDGFVMERRPDGQFVKSDNRARPFAMMTAGKYGLLDKVRLKCDDELASTRDFIIQTCSNVPDPSCFTDQWNVAMNTCITEKIEKLFSGKK